MLLYNIRITVRHIRLAADIWINYFPLKYANYFCHCVVA